MQKPQAWAETQTASQQGNPPPNTTCPAPPPGDTSESARAGGTRRNATIVARLPVRLAPSDSTLDLEAPDMQPGSSAGRGLVLVVEDEHAIAELIRLYLRREGLGVRVETTGPARFTASRPPPPVA